MKGRNASGVGHKQPRQKLDEGKLLCVRRIVFHYFPASYGEQEGTLWINCTGHINSCIRTRENTEEETTELIDIDILPHLESSRID